MIIFSDLHLCEKTADTVFDQVLPGIYDASRKYGFSDVLCLGDFYHIRYKVDVSIQNRVFDYFNMLNTHGIKVYLLPGNHDQINVKGDNALQPFDELEGVTVFSDPTITDKGVFIPYRKDKSDIIDWFTNHNIANQPVFIHHGFQGFTINNSIVDKDGLDRSLFGKDRMVICGHYHKAQQIDNVYYVGSPYQIDAGESGQEKGYCVFDNQQLLYVRTDWGTKYYDGNYGEAKTGDVVRIKAPENVDLEQYRKSLNLPEGVRCIVEPTIPENNCRLGSDISTIQGYAEAYVNEFSGNLDPNILMDVFNQLGV